MDIYYSAKLLFDGDYMDCSKGLNEMHLFKFVIFSRYLTRSKYRSMLLVYIYIFEGLYVSDCGSYDGFFQLRSWLFWNIVYDSTDPFQIYKSEHLYRKNSFKMTLPYKNRLEEVTCLSEKCALKLKLWFHNLIFNYFVYK